MNSYEMKQEARRQTLLRRAERLRQGSEAAYQGARSALAGIEPGQPILVGHHSEKRHRRALARHDQRMRKAIETERAAAELERKADAVGDGGISADDPDAVAKLLTKLTGMKRKRDQMKKVNAAWRVNDPEKRLAKLAECGIDAAAAERLTAEIAKLHPWDRTPFPSYALSNLGANIRRVEKRIQELDRLAWLRENQPHGATQPLELTTAPTEGAQPVEITADVADNRVLVKFPARLTRDSYKGMRSMGFLWSPTRGAFVRKLTGCSVAAAAAIVARLGIQYEG